MGRGFAGFYSLGSTYENGDVWSVSASCFPRSPFRAPGRDSCCLDFEETSNADKKSAGKQQKLAKYHNRYAAPAPSPKPAWHDTRPVTSGGTCDITLGALKDKYSEFTVFLTFQDDNQKTLWNAAKADLNNVVAKSQIQYFVRRVVVGAMNRMVWKHTRNPSTFSDCNVLAADDQAKASAVQLLYDDSTLTLKVQFNVAIPMYWVAATTVDQCSSPPPAKKDANGIASVNPASHTVNADSIMQAMVYNVFYSAANSGNYCNNVPVNGVISNGVLVEGSTKADCQKNLQRDLIARQAISDEASQLRGMGMANPNALPPTQNIVSQLVRALNPNIPPAKKDVVSYLRGLLLKSGTPAKVVAMGVKGTAVTKKGG